MAQQETSPSTAICEPAVNHLHNRDDTVLQALVTAAAFVALADGQADAVEREELINFVDRQGFVPSISRDEIGRAFDNRVRQLEERDRAETVAQALRPLAGLPLASIVIRTARQVAAADWYLHPGEARALKLIGLVLAGNQDPAFDSSHD
jgi:tellurite resistance protein